MALDVLDKGVGEPVVFVHGDMGDECAAVLEEPILVNQYRLVHYHRRGFGRSHCPAMPVTIAQQVADLRAIMHHFSIKRAHLVGESYGAAILLQMALDADTLFLSDLPALRTWHLNPEDVASIWHPVLNMGGEQTTPSFRKIHEALKTWLPHAENFVLPAVRHAMLVPNPKGASGRLAGFFSSHPIGQWQSQANFAKPALAPGAVS